MSADGVSPPNENYKFAVDNVPQIFSTMCLNHHIEALPHAFDEALKSESVIKRLLIKFCCLKDLVGMRLLAYRMLIAICA
jgi:hypothetical protein